MFQNSTSRRELKRRFAERILEMSEDIRSKKPRVGISDAAVALMSRWFDDHFAYPYPTDEEKVSGREQGGG